MSDSVNIPARFNGPLGSGNGGYSAGAFSAFVDGAAEVRLRRPVPLDRPLRVDRNGDGAGEVRVLDGEELVAEARPAPDFELEVPEPIGLREARMAAARYRGQVGGPFSRCFVCGRDREDSLEVFAGAVNGRDLVASPWLPPAWAADGSGAVRPEVVWGILDCPTYFASYLGHEEDPLPMAVLGRLTGRLDARVAAGGEYVVIAWPLGVEGRKRHAGSALLSARGRVLASARALLIEMRPD